MSRALRRLGGLLRHPAGRLCFAVLAMVAAFGLRRLLQPLTGTGAPFVLFFGAVAVTSAVAGPGPGALAAVLGAPAAAREFVANAGYPASQAVWQAGMFLVDCGLVVSLSAAARRAHRTASEAAEALTLATEASALACWDLDLATGRVRWRPASAAPIRFPGGAPGTHADWLASIHPDDRAAFAAEHRRSLDPADGQLRVEARVRGADGAARWVSWEGACQFRDAAGARLAVRQVGTAMDVSARRERERTLVRLSDELHRSEARVRSLIELAPDAFFLADLDGRYVDVNQEACRMLGFERHELIGKTIVELIAPNEVAKLAADREHLQRPGTIARGEFHLRRKDGTFVPVEVSANIVPGGGWQAFVRDVADRNRREAALRESEERFRLALDEAPIGMALIGLDGRFLRVNAALCEIVGYPAGELQRIRFQEIMHPDDVDVAVALAEHLTRGEMPRYQLEKRYIRKDGGLVTVMLSVSVLRAPDGAPVCHIAQIEDITSRRSAEDALRLSEARFSGIVSIASDAIVSVDEQQRIVLFNDGAERIFGHRRGDVLGAPLDVLIPTRLRERHRGHVVAFAAGPMAARPMGQGRPDVLGLRKNGEEFPVEAAISRIHVDGRSVLTAVLRDVTEQRRRAREQQTLADVGQALAASLDYERTLATVGDVVVKDLADWCIIDIAERVNEPRRVRISSRSGAHREIAGEVERLQLDRAQPSLVGRVVRSGQPYVIERVTPQILESLSQSEQHLRLLRFVDPRSVMALPLLIGGELLGAIVFISSSPDRRYTTADLPFAEALVARAALGIENGRLYDAALRATQIRDQVLGFVAHDLRNPLAAIQMQATAMRRRSEPERRNLKYRDGILRAAGRMERLIRDLLDVTRASAGPLAIERTVLAARQLVVDAVEPQQPLARDGSRELRLDLRGDLPDVVGDRDRLLQVFENLIGNAIKFTAPGGSITVGARAGPDAVTFWVADDGQGMSTEQAERVFDRFWQARPDARHGAGLGLAIARSIVEAHAGHIWVDSHPGRGTTFYFTVPLARGLEAPGREAGLP